MKNKTLILMIISIFMMFIMIFGASYSYFAAQGVGSGDDRQVTTTVGELKLTYTDGSEYLTTNGDWEPGDYVTKTFTVTNNSSTTAYYRIYMDDVVNTFVMQKKDEQGNTISDAPYELIYTLKKNDDVVIIEASNTPVLNDAGIIYGSDGLGIEIEKGAIDTYELTIKFIDTEENQNYNQAKIFSAIITLNNPKEKPKTIHEKITSLMESRNDIDVDDYDNIRFIGKDVNNYIVFNEEKWRVVGLFKNIILVDNSGNTKKSDLLKIVRDSSIGDIPWDTKNKNSWPNSTLKNILNGDYLNSLGIYKLNGLANEKDKIANVRWNLGGYATSGVNTLTMYQNEHGSVGSATNKSVITWDGKIGLIYPSDYGYAAGSECAKSTNLNEYQNVCKDNDWLYNDDSKWYISSPSSYATGAGYIVYTGSSSSGDAARENVAVYPSLYLIPDIKLIGSGKKDDPFRIVE